MVALAKAAGNNVFGLGEGFETITQSNLARVPALVLVINEPEAEKEPSRSLVRSKFGRMNDPNNVFDPISYERRPPNSKSYTVVIPLCWWLLFALCCSHVVSINGTDQNPNQLLSVKCKVFFLAPFCCRSE